MHALITIQVCAGLLFVPGGDFLIPFAVIGSIWIGHLRNKND